MKRYTQACLVHIARVALQFRSNMSPEYTRSHSNDANACEDTTRRIREDYAPVLPTAFTFTPPGF